MNAKKIAQFALGPVLGAALSFFTLPMLTWICTTEDIGRISMLNVTISFCALFFSLGLNQAYVREYHESSDKGALFKACLLPGLLITTAALTVLSLIPGLISKLLFDLDSVPISLMVAFCVWFSFVSIFLSLILRMQEKGLAFSISQLMPKVLFLLVVSAYAGFKYKFDFSHIVLAQTFALIAGTMVFMWTTRHDLMAAFSKKIDRVELKRLIEFGAPLILSSLAFWGLTTTDKVFLRSFSSYDQLAVYSVAVSFAGAALVFQNIFATIWAPIVYRWVAEGVEPQRFHKSTEYVLSIVVALFALTGLFSGLIKYILPANYYDAQFLLLACMGYPLFYTLSETTVVGLGIARKSSYSMYASVGAVLVNLIGNYLLVPLLGAAGAAIATAISFWCFFLLRTELSCRAWTPMPRKRIYLTTLFCLIFSILFVFFGKKNEIYFMIVWLGLLLRVLYCSKNEICKLLKGEISFK